MNFLLGKNDAKRVIGNAIRISTAKIITKYTKYII